MKNYLFLAALLLPLWSSSQADTHVEIRRSIRKEAQKHFKYADYPSPSEQVYVYMNRFLAEIWEEDTLVFSSFGDDTADLLFKSYYEWKEDTLEIHGLFSVNNPGDNHIRIRVINEDISTEFIPFTEYPNTALTPEGSFTNQPVIPCPDARLVLSGNPKKGKDKLIYGCAEFTTADFYTDGGSNFPPIRYRVRMKVYFKAAEWKGNP